MFPHSGGSSVPFAARVPVHQLMPASFAGPGGTAPIVNEAIAAETPRDSRIGLKRLNTPSLLVVTGFELTVSSVGAASWASFAAAASARIWFWRNNTSTGLPTALVSGMDTGAITFANARTAAGSDAETGSSGRGRIVLTLPAPTILVPGDYTLALACNKSYTGAPTSETTFNLVTHGGPQYAPFGGSTTAAIRRSYGYELSGATSSLSAYSPPSSLALGSIADHNGFGEAEAAINLLCASGI